MFDQRENRVEVIRNDKRHGLAATLPCSVHQNNSLSAVRDILAGN